VVRKWQSQFLHRQKRHLPTFHLCAFEPAITALDLMKRLQTVAGLLALPFMVGGCAMAPSPLTDEQMSGLTNANLMRLTADQPPVQGQISFYEAVARALKYNLDDQVAVMEAALRAHETRQLTANMLPGVTVNAGHVARNNDLSTASLDLPTGIEVPAFSTSQDRAFNSGDATFSWNILDFALSYVRAQQASDKHLMAQEARRKVTQRIIEDTRTAYWRAVSCDRMVKKFDALETRVKRSVANTRSAAKAGAETPLTALTYERELVQIRQTAERLGNELRLAKSQLAALMNVPPGTDYALVEKDYNPDPPVFSMSPREMVAEAIFNRPEIRDIAYQQRVTEREATAAIVELLPGLRVYGTAAFDDTSLLLNNHWMDWGVSAAGNLLKIVQLPAKRAAIEAQADVLSQKALAITMTVMTQVYISVVRYNHLAEQVVTARDYLSVQTRLVHQLRAEKSAELIGEQTLIREEMNLLVAEVQHDLAVGSLQTASSNLMTSMGYDLQGKSVDLKMDVKVLAQHLSSNWSNRSAVSDRGRYLFELEKAREEERRRQAEAERRRKAEAQRVAEAAARFKAEQVNLQKAEFKRAQDEAARVKKASTDRVRMEAAQAKQAAIEVRRGAARKGVPKPVETSGWDWLWPGDPAPLPVDGTATKGNKKSGPYTGTK
jgi:outer membrane protein TolC